MNTFLKRNFHWILAGILLIIVLLFAFVSPGYYGGTDNISHYLFARYAYRHPWLFLHSWGRPLYTTLSSPFAQFGFRGSQVFNILLGIATAWLCYRIARSLEIGNPLLVMILVCFTPLYFLMMPTALTEILFGFVFVLTVFLFIRGHYIAAAIVISFLPFARSEGYIMLPVFLILFFRFRQYRAIPFLAFGLVFLSLIGSFYFGDILWVYHQFPYPVTYHHPIYSKGGELWYFVIARDYITGLPIEILFIAGTLTIIRDLFSSDRRVRHKAVLIGSLALLPFLLYFAFHSVLYWKALGGSMGLARVLAAMLPLAALVCLEGFDGLEKVLRLPVWPNRIFMGAVIIAVVYTNFRDVPIPYPRGPEEEVIKKTCDWYQASPYAGSSLYWTDTSVPFFLDIDRFSPYTTGCYELAGSKTLDTIHPNSMIIWDAHFGANEARIRPDTILRHPRLRLIQLFKPPMDWVTFGGYHFECYIMKVMLPGQQADNYAIRDSIMDIRERSSALRNLYSANFEPAPGSSDTMRLSRVARSGKYSYIMDDRTEFSPGINIPVSSLPKNPEINGIRVSVFINIPGGPSDYYNTPLVITFEQKHQSYSYTALGINQKNVLPGHWKRFSLSAGLPVFKSPDDRLIVYIWNPGKQVFYMDDMRVDLVKIE